MPDIQQRITQRNDNSAFRAFFARYDAKAKAFFMARGATNDLADQLARQALVKTWHRLDLERTGLQNADSHVFVAARNIAIDTIDKCFVWHLQMPVNDRSDPPTAGAKSLSERMTNLAARKVLDQIPPDEHRTLEQVFLKGFTAAALARKAKKSAKHVRVELNRLSRRLLNDTSTITGTGASDSVDRSFPISHHPDAASLTLFAAGVLAEPSACVIAAHSELCPACRQDIECLETFGGVFLSRIRASKTTADPPALELRRVEARLLGNTHGAADHAHMPVPATIAQFTGDCYEQMNWRRLALGWRALDLPLTRQDGSRLQLVKLSGSATMPRVRRTTPALMMILSGFCHTDRLSFGYGDVIERNILESQPITSDEFEGCIALVANDIHELRGSFLSRLIPSRLILSRLTATCSGSR